MSPYRRQLPAEAAGALDQLSGAVEVYRAETQRLADQLAVAVVACIEAGATWGEVGQRLGISKQAARAHWARYLDQDQPTPE
jgi:hypothetical protein